MSAIGKSFSYHFYTFNWEWIHLQDPNLYMVSQDVDYLFTNIPLDKTIDTCIDSLYDDNENNPRLFVICLT